MFDWRKWLGTVWNSREDGAPRKYSCDMRELTEFERLFTMEVYGVKHNGVSIQPDLCIRANKITGEITSWCIFENEDGA